MAVTKVDISMLEDISAGTKVVAVAPSSSGNVLTSDGTNWTSAAATAGGDSRNFIIDGDFTQWPEGNKTNQTTNVYGPALWRITQSTSSSNMDMTQSTTVPTFAQSSHTSEFSFLIDVGSVADATPSTNDLKLMRYFVTGSDYTYLHSKEVTLAFWVKGSTIGQYGVAFKNSATDRGYVTSFSLVAANTWEYKTITLTLDTTGTWLFTEADIGLIIEFAFLCGANRLSSSPGSWQAENKFGSSGQVNMMALTTNNIAFSQVGLYLGATAPTFLGESVATVANQVHYYVNRVGGDIANGRAAAGVAINSNTIQHALMHPRRMRAAPAYSFSGTSWTSNGANTKTDSTPTASVMTPVSANWKLDGLSGMTAGDGYITYHPTAGDYLLFDARH